LNFDKELPEAFTTKLPTCLQVRAQLPALLPDHLSIAMIKRECHGQTPHAVEVAVF